MTRVDALLVEEDASKVEQTLRALQDGGLSTVFHSSDPQLALNYMLGDLGPPAGRIHMVILELLLPGNERLEMLSALKRDQRTHSIPAIVLAATDRPRDIARCYASGANIVVVRPDDYTKLVEKARAIAQWFLGRQRVSSEPRILLNSRSLEPAGDDTFAGAVWAAH
jgi:CheY-like chemotaxis protein